MNLRSFIVLTISQEITEGVNKSAQALQAAKTGIQHIGSVAQQQTMCMYNMFSEIPLLFFLCFSSFNLIHIYDCFSTVAFSSFVIYI